MRAALFGLLRGAAVKEFASYHLPEQSFVYLLHPMREERVSPARMVGAPDWRMFLMRPGDVEQELLRLHQFKKLEYERKFRFTQKSGRYFGPQWSHDSNRIAFVCTPKTVASRSLLMVCATAQTGGWSCG